MTTFVLAIDQGTTSSRAMLFRSDLSLQGMAQVEIPQHYPASRWVELDPGDLWRSVRDTVRAVLVQTGTTASQVAALGITNQRETALVWDRATGQPIRRAIVWQDRRTADLCTRLRAQGGRP